MILAARLTFRFVLGRTQGWLRFDLVRYSIDKSSGLHHQLHHHSWRGHLRVYRASLFPHLRRLLRGRFKIVCLHPRVLTKVITHFRRSLQIWRGNARADVFPAQPPPWLIGRPAVQHQGLCKRLGLISPITLLLAALHVVI